MEHIRLQKEKPDAVESLASGIAHDLNNLLSAIKGRASLMLNSITPTDPLHPHVMEIINCIDKGSDIADQLLGFARVDEYYTAPIDINRLIRKILENLDLAGRKITLDANLATQILIVNADIQKMEQVFNSIIINAIMAMPDGGKLTVVSESAKILNSNAESYGVAPGMFVKITISDTGIGMDKEVVENVFTPFFTADHKKFPEKKGLGLTFAKEIIMNHNGAIDVWSSPGVGSSFAIILPLNEITESPDIPEKSDQMLMGNESILLVDDEERILTVGREICKALGYAVTTADSGQKAIEIYKANKGRFNLVILDMIMPEMNGLETFKVLKQINPDVKVLLSTGYSIDDKAQEMLNAGCKGYILKPYSVIDFSHKIREVLER